MPAKIVPEAELSKGDLWVFGYGSLMWRPGFDFVEQVPARLIGEHRALCVYSFDHRGTPEKPGLVLGLDRGGACRGVAFRLPSALALDELHLLWRREMVVGSYRPVWVRVRAGGRVLTALAFAVRRDHPQYAALSMDEQADTIAHACGAFGSSCEYLTKTRSALAEHGIVDAYLERLAADVATRQR